MNFSIDSTDGIKFGDGFNVRKNGSGTIGQVTFSKDKFEVDKGFYLGGKHVTWANITYVTGIESIKMISSDAYTFATEPSTSQADITCTGSVWIPNS